MKNYAWLITKDYLFDENFDHKSSVGVCGPSTATDEQIASLKRGEGIPFRMYSDDGDLDYEGLFWGCAKSEDAFGPLDDYGTPNAGSTRIKYYNPTIQQWEDL